MCDGEGGLRLLLTLTDEEVGVLSGQLSLDLPLPSLEASDQPQQSTARRTAERSLVARGLYGDDGNPADDVKGLIGGLRDQSVRAERLLAHRTDFLRAARLRADWIVDLITEDGFHQFVTGPEAALAQFLTDWVVPVECAHLAMPELRLSRRQVVDDPAVLARLGDIDVVTTLTADHLAGQGVSIYAGADHAVRATVVGDEVAFSAIDRAGLRALTASVLGSGGP